MVKSQVPPKPTQVGSHLDAVCGKCRDVTNHVVLALIGGRPTRVECRACHAMHQFRPPPGSASAAKGPAKKAASKGTGRRGAAPAPAPEDLWARAMRQATGTPIAYSPGQRYEAGQLLRHATFGEGVVTRLASPTVCEVTFRGGVRKLLMAS